MPQLTSLYRLAFSAQTAKADALKRRPHPLRDYFGLGHSVYVEVSKRTDTTGVRQVLQPTVFNSYSSILNVCTTSILWIEEYYDENA